MKTPDPVVNVLVQDLIHQLYTESNYILEFQTHFAEMKTQLNHMQSFISDADSIKEKHKTIKTTLIDLRELTYEADDLLIDCLIRADYHTRRVSSSCYHRFSLRQIYFHYQTGKKLSCINNRIGKMRQNLNDYVTPILGRSSDEDASNRTIRWTSQVYDQSGIVGLTEDTSRIKGWILGSNEALHRVGIVGMGGLGKTTIAQKIFNDTHVIARFEKRIWVSISQTFSELEIMKSILRQVREDDSGSDTGQMLHRIHQLLSHKSYLIVMDDVWSTANGWWDRISNGLAKTPGHSSCIIITSRIEEVAKNMGVVDARIHRPRLLDEEESWSLFCKVAFMATKGICKNLQIEGMGKEIVKKCRGLPLAIKTTGGLLYSKTSFSEWKRICDNFHEKLATEGNSSVMASLQLSYDELPAHLKHCILCFSIYPEDHEINVEQLVRWWIGEGFVHERRSETVTETAYRFLSELIDRCLVDVMRRRNYDGRVYSCKMHDMVRDLTIRIAREEAFSSFDDGGRQIPTMDSRRLGVTNEMKFHSLENNSKIRALLLMDSRSIILKRNAGLAKVMSLRVLDLSHVTLENIRVYDFWGWISSLKRLACLNLRDVASLIEVPDSIGKLWNLQILILAECSNLQKLPASITTLHKLIVLDLGNCPALKYLPQGISGLSNLQELYGFKPASLAHTESCHFGELKNFIDLRVLHLDINQESIIEDEELGALADLQKLRVLLINAEHCEDVNILEKLNKLTPPPHLEELYLGHYHGEATPDWINPNSLPELQYLCLEYARLVDMSPLFWSSDGGNSWEVEGLCLKFLPRLQVEWSRVQSVMPSLRYLEVSHCYMLQSMSFPCDVVNLGSWMKRDEESEDGNLIVDTINAQQSVMNN